MHLSSESSSLQVSRLALCAGSPTTVHGAAGMTTVRQLMDMTAAVAAAVLMRHAPGAALCCTASRTGCGVADWCHPHRMSSLLRGSHACNMLPGRRRSPDEQLHARSREADRERGQQGGLPGRDRDRDPDRDADQRRRTRDSDWERHRGSAEAYDRDRDWRDGSRKRGRPGESVRDGDWDRCLIPPQSMTTAYLSIALTGLRMMHNIRCKQ